MKPLRALFAGTVLVTSLTIAAPVSADLPVIDISNLKQSILTAAHTRPEVNNQITQIQQFVQMLENEARNLLSLPFSALQQITSAIDQVNSLMRQAQSLAYDVARIDRQFEQLFPTYGGNIHRHSRQQKTVDQLMAIECCGMLNSYAGNSSAWPRLTMGGARRHDRQKTAIR